MKRLFLLGILGLGLILFGAGQALAADVTISVPTTFAIADTSDGTVDHVFRVAGNLTIATGGSITCNDNPGLPSGASACPIKIVVDGNFVMEAGTKILAENQVNGGSGGDISITVGGDVTLKGPLLGLGALISSSKTSGAGDTGHSGNITLDVTGNVKIEIGSIVQAGGSNASGNGGAIEITGTTITVDGQVLSTGGTTVGRGGPITIVADCNLFITGKVSSKGRDPGADRVHLEGGCDVQIFGLVESTGPGHTVPGANLCHGTERPDKPANSTACVEVWAGDSLEIDSTSPHNGEVNADTGMSGGTQGTSWIDLFARGNITITGDIVNPYAVHANQTLGNGHGGIIHVASRDGKVETSGRAIQANDTSSGGKGGQVSVEASGPGSPDGDVDFGNASIQARGGSGSGSLVVSISARSWNGKILGVVGGELNACPPGTSSVTLEACLGVFYPVPQTCPSPPIIINPPNSRCGGVVLFTDYVKLPPCICGCVCVSSFSPKTGKVGDTVTIKGTSLKSVTQVFFNSANCNPAGTEAIITKTDTQIKVTVPGLNSGFYNLVINIEGLNSICMADPFIVP
jgi:hypothetical protein